MRKWKKLLAAALSVTLLTSLMAAPSYAEETQKKGWKYEDNVWHYYREDGTMPKGREKLIHGKLYAFKENSAMYEDTLFAAPSEGHEQENAKPNRYAYPDGHLADRNWVKLDALGHMYDAKNAKKDEPIYWYYFGEANLDPENPTGGEMFVGDDDKVDGDRKIHGSTYRFHEDGHMYSKEWYGFDSTMERPNDNSAYYQVNGDRAMKKWLYLEDTWYHFNKEGKVDEVWNEEIAGTATDSNAKAPYPAVESVETVGEKEISATVGKPVKLKFQIHIASDSNAEQNIFSEDAHDIWGTETLLGKFSIIDITEKGLCTVEYTPKVVGIEDNVALYVDTVNMKSDPFTVTAGLGELKDDEAKKDAVNALIDSLIDDTLIKGDMEETLDAIKEVFVSADENNEELKKVVKGENYEKLDKLYAMKNGIEVSEDYAKAQSVLGDDGTVSLVGGALNAKGTEAKSVALKVDTAEIPQDLKEKAESTHVVVTLDIAMNIGDNAVDGVLDFPVKITMTIPKGLDPKKNITLYHYHGDEEPTEIPLELEDDKISFTTSKFSTFAFEQKKEENKPNPTPSTPDRDNDDDSSSSTGNSSNGQWILDSKGWWYKNSNGSYPANTWSYLEYNHVKDWYRFDQNGYMVTGWFTDADGLRYYMNPVSNGFRGAMQTGWQLIDGQWYYFNTSSDGHKGMLYVNTVTPDGYHVNESGQIID